MQREQFEQMVQQMAGEVPVNFLDGITEIVVSPRAVPHPDRDGVFTMGECIPLAIDSDGPESVQSRVVLYHGSFLALAEMDPEFDWQQETWETLAHELRHHVEWRARNDDLESLDAAAEQNFARHDGEPFDPLFFQGGEELEAGTFQVGNDTFIDRIVVRVPERVHFIRDGTGYTVAVPAGATLPAYLVVSGARLPSDGDLVVVIREKPSFRDLFRARKVWQGRAEARIDSADDPSRSVGPFPDR